VYPHSSPKQHKLSCRRYGTVCRIVWFSRTHGTEKEMSINWLSMNDLQPLVAEDLTTSKSDCVCVAIDRVSRQVWCYRRACSDEPQLIARYQRRAITGCELVKRRAVTDRLLSPAESPTGWLTGVLYTLTNCSANRNCSSNDYHLSRRSLDVLTDRQ